MFCLLKQFLTLLKVVHMHAKNKVLTWNIPTNIVWSDKLNNTILFCSLSKHWYHRSQYLKSWMTPIPKVKCSDDPDCHLPTNIHVAIMLDYFVFHLKKKSQSDIKNTVEVWILYMYLIRKWHFTIPIID